MAWYPTNADDVTLIVSRVLRDDAGNRTGSETLAETSAVVVDDFSIDEEQDLEELSGLGNFESLGISKGDVTRSFSFTVQGEDADLFQGLASENGDANELEIVVRMEEYTGKLAGAYAGTRSLSASSGDPVELEVEGVARRYDG